MKIVRDRLDAQDIAWFESWPQPGEECCACRERLGMRSKVLVERLLPGVGLHPRALHRKCWEAHNARLQQTAAVK